MVPDADSPPLLFSVIYKRNFTSAMLVYSILHLDQRRRIPINRKVSEENRHKNVES